MCRGKTWGLVILLWVALGAFDVIKSEFFPEKYQHITAIRLITFFSWRFWLIILLALLIGVLLEGGYAALQERDKKWEEERRGIESTHALIIRDLSEKAEDLRRQLADEKLKQKAPRLFLDFSNSVAAQYAMTFSGLVLKNDGGRAFNVEFQPEVRFGLTIRLDNPTQSIDGGEVYAIHVTCCELKGVAYYPVGGMQSGQVQSLFERLSTEGTKGFTVTIKCVDFDKNSIVSRSILRWDIWTKQIRCERV